MTHISAGDVLREELAKLDGPSPESSEYGTLISELIDTGAIVPGYVTASLIENKVRRVASERQKSSATVRPRFLIDGFPRNQNNRTEYEKRVSVVVCVCVCVSVCLCVCLAPDILRCCVTHSTHP
jgi:UMP-CMP kinase